MRAMFVRVCIPFRVASSKFCCEKPWTLRAETLAAEEEILARSASVEGRSRASISSAFTFHQGQLKCGSLRQVRRRAQLSDAVEPTKFEIWHQRFGAQDSPAGTTASQRPTFHPKGLNSAKFVVVGVSPQVEEGYYTPSAEPLKSFKCMSAVDCPGGPPGTCGGGREGIPCGECPDGSYFSGECRKCSPWSMIGWICGLVIVAIGLILAYYLLNSPVTTKASTLFTTTCALGMMISMLQTLGIIGTMTAPRKSISRTYVLRWLCQ